MTLKILICFWFVAAVDSDNGEDEEAEAEAADNCMVECCNCQEKKNIGTCQMMHCKNHFLCTSCYETWRKTDTKCPACYPDDDGDLD